MAKFKIGDHVKVLSLSTIVEISEGDDIAQGWGSREYKGTDYDDRACCSFNNSMTVFCEEEAIVISVNSSGSYGLKFIDEKLQKLNTWNWEDWMIGVPTPGEKKEKDQPSAYVLTRAYSMKNFVKLTREEAKLFNKLLDAGESDYQLMTIEDAIRRFMIE